MVSVHKAYSYPVVSVNTRYCCCSKRTGSHSIPLPCATKQNVATVKGSVCFPPQFEGMRGLQFETSPEVHDYVSFTIGAHCHSLRPLVTITMMIMASSVLRRVGGQKLNDLSVGRSCIVSVTRERGTKDRKRRKIRVRTASGRILIIHSLSAT